MIKKRFSDSGIGVIIGILGIVMFSAKAVMVKLGYRFGVDAVTLLLLRMLFALPFYLLILYRESRKEHGYNMVPKDFIQIVALGCIGYYLASYFDFFGLQYISASLERLILFIYPTLVILISAIFLGKRITRVQILAILITYVGILVAFVEDLSFASEHLWLGTGAIFLSALTYAAYLVGSGTMIPRIGAVRFTAYAMTVSCMMVIVHYAVTNTSEVLDQPAEIYALGFAMAVFSTVIPSFLISEAIKHLGASNFAIYGSLGPISTILLAILFLGERIDIYQLVGTVIVIAGVSTINVRKI